MLTEGICWPILMECLTSVGISGIDVILDGRDPNGICGKIEKGRGGKRRGKRKLWVSKALEESNRRR